MRLFNEFPQTNWKKHGLDELPKKLTFEPGTFQLVSNPNVSGHLNVFASFCDKCAALRFAR